VELRKSRVWMLGHPPMLQSMYALQSGTLGMGM
jgi:hypothetical protein